MSGFPIVSLGELISLERRPVDIVPEAKYTEIGIYCFGRGIFHKPPRSGVEVGNKELFLIKEGDFILQVTFAWEGAVALASASEEGMYGSVRFPTFRVKEDICFPPYLVNYFRTPQGREQLIRISPGSAGRNRVLSMKRIPDIKIPLPSLTEQHRIIARIEELAATVAEARELRRDAVKKTHALFSAVLASVFDRGNFQNTTYYQLASNGWASIVAGQHIMADEYNLSNDGVPYLTGPADFGARVPQVKRWTNTPKTMALPGDVLLTVKGAGVGKLNFAPDFEVTIGRQLMAIRPNPDKLSRGFLFYFLDYKFKHFQSIATATTVPGFKKTDVEKLMIPALSLREQKRIVTYLEGVASKVDSLKQLQSQTSAELDAMMPAVLDKAFKGEL